MEVRLCDENNNASKLQTKKVVSENLAWFQVMNFFKHLYLQFPYKDFAQIFDKYFAMWFNAWV